MKLKLLHPESLLRDPRSRLLLNYLNALADLAHPKQALPILVDAERLAAYQQGIQAAVAEQASLLGTPPHVVVLGAGGGILGLLAGQAGAGRATCIERSRMLYRMAKQALEANRGRPGMGAVHLLDRRLQSVGVAGEELPPDLVAQQPQQQQDHQQQQQQQQHLHEQDQQQQQQLPPVGQASSASGPDGEGSAPGTASQDAGAFLPGRASLLVTDLLDHSVLGMGLLNSIDDAARRLLAPGARVIPQSIQARLHTRCGPLSLCVTLLVTTC